jgi:hypothetical protein
MNPVQTVGSVLSRIKVAPVKLPALSVTMNIYVLSTVIAVPLVYAAQFNVAHERFVSLNVID